MTTKRRPVRFPIRSRTTLGAPFGQHPALSTRRRQPLLAQKRSSNKFQLSCALTGGEYRQAAGAITEGLINKKGPQNSWPQSPPPSSLGCRLRTHSNVNLCDRDHMTNDGCL